MTEPLRPLHYDHERMQEKVNGGLDSLDRVLFTDEYGIDHTLGDTIESKTFTARFTYMKTLFLSVCKTKTEKQIGTLLFQGYSMKEVSQKIHKHYDRVRHIVVVLRKRCREFQKQLNSQLKQQ